MKPDSDAANRTEPSSSARVQRPTILLVSLGDADPEIVSLLERGGYEVVTAGGDTALQNLEPPPDAIAVDLLVPDTAGFVLCERLRAAAGRRPIMILAERGAATDIAAGLASGADDYLVKPAAMEELLARFTALRRRATWRAQITNRPAVACDTDETGQPSASSQASKPPTLLSWWSLS